MASYLSRLEFLIDKWQSRRKTLEISQPVAASRHRCCQLGENSTSKYPIGERVNNNKQHEESPESGMTKIQQQQQPIKRREEEEDQQLDYMGEQMNPIRFHSEIKSPLSSSAATTTTTATTTTSMQTMTQRVARVDGAKAADERDVSAERTSRISDRRRYQQHPRQQQLVRSLRNDDGDALRTTSHIQNTEAPAASQAAAITQAASRRGTTECPAALLCASLAIIALTSCLLAVGSAHAVTATATVTASATDQPTSASVSGAMAKYGGAGETRRSDFSAPQSRDQQASGGSFKLVSQDVGREGRHDDDLGKSLARSLGSIARQLASGSSSSLGFRDRWLNVDALTSSAASNSASSSSSQAIRDHNRRRQPPLRGLSGVAYLTRALNNLRNRIGSRNSIRVHNAFRDFAWRVLSRLSMPTPVIYELRRQHFYSPEEDQLNDMLFNKNTTRTIRSKRQLSLAIEQLLVQSLVSGSMVANASALLLGRDYQERKSRLGRSLHSSMASLGKGLGKAIDGPGQQRRRIGRDDDDGTDNESLRDRLQSRLDRRQEGDKTTQMPMAPQRSRRRRDRKRKAKESDKQMIFINGKEYYVDDEGKLKEAKS